ncbi:MAG: hypothetical protein F6J98_25925 [Moorea sp. SIO4G2]|nr:hypothetical protein [Moorena sp. SIO4A3]NEO63682.1 hypothetical protein [Moorena sp. SIO4G2]
MRCTRSLFPVPCSLFPTTAAKSNLSLLFLFGSSSNTLIRFIYNKLPSNYRFTF